MGRNLSESIGNALLLKVSEGDNTAFRKLHDAYGSFIRAVVRKYISDEDECNEITQQVFIALWENRQAIEASQSVAGWLFVVSYHRSIAWLKIALRQSLLQTELGAEIYPDEQEASLKDRQLQLLEVAIRQLSPQKQRVFELCKLQGKTYEEAANELNISKHTVKEYLSLAISGIKEYVKNHPEYIILLVSTFLRPPY